MTISRRETAPVTGRAGRARPASRPTPATTRLLTALAPPLATLAVALWGITSSSYWRDEAATMTAVRRSFGQLVQLLGHTDVEHGAYYMVMWLLVRIAGAGELATRLPSAIAMAAAAAAIAGTGNRLVSPRAGLAAGLVFAVVPSTSLYGQDARPDALAVGLAATATYLLVRLLQQGGKSWRWLAAYSTCLAMLGLIDILGLLVAAAHAITVVAAALGRNDRAAARVMWQRWLISASAAMLFVSPLIWLSYRQRRAISWIRPPSMAVARRLVGMVAPMPQAHTSYAPFALSMLAAIALGVLASATRGRVRLRSEWPPGLVATCLPWLFVPAAILLAVSMVTPVFIVRYILFCAPALTLLTGAGLAALGRIAGLAAFMAIAVLSVPAQVSIRTPDGHGENIRLADQIVAAAMRPGDAAIFHNASVEKWSWAYAYPYGFAQLKDVSQAETPAQSGTLAGTAASRAVIRRRLAGLARIWVVDLRVRGRAPTLHGDAFRLVHRWRVGDIRLFLYARAPSPLVA